GKVFVKVSDNGPGISDEEKSHVFEMFYNGKKDISDSRRSMGMGLALCKSIIEAHGGQIRVTSNKPCGATFIFTLPESEKVGNNE
ncbi:MAG: sensor histidine kinase, partial [Lachnospiraceae bacterium]|nr:sensor histidine kinase [Lachnospiraceae bacterium]